MICQELLVECAYDETVNAAEVKFSKGLEGGEFISTTIPIVVHGEVVGIVSFRNSGELFSIELLNAKIQLPGIIEKNV